MSATKPVFQHAILGKTSENEAEVTNDCRLMTEASFKGLGKIPDTPAQIVRMPVMLSEDRNLLVDGSSQEKIFTLDADSSKDIYINELRLIFSAQDIKMDGGSFGSRDTLTNGIKIEVVSNGITTQLANLQLNECLLAFGSPDAQLVFNNTGAYDALATGLLLYGIPVLKAGTSDKVKVTVRDNLTHVTYKHMCLVVYGTKET